MCKTLLNLYSQKFIQKPIFVINVSSLKYFKYLMNITILGSWNEIIFYSF